MRYLQHNILLQQFNDIALTRRQGSVQSITDGAILMLLHKLYPRRSKRMPIYLARSVPVVQFDYFTRGGGNRLSEVCPWDAHHPGHQQGDCKLCDYAYYASDAAFEKGMMDEEDDRLYGSDDSGEDWNGSNLSRCPEIRALNKHAKTLDHTGLADDVFFLHKKNAQQSAEHASNYFQDFEAELIQMTDEWKHGGDKSKSAPSESSSAPSPSDLPPADLPDGPYVPPIDYSTLLRPLILTEPVATTGLTREEVALLVHYKYKPDTEWLTPLITAAEHSRALFGSVRGVTVVSSGEDTWSLKTTSPTSSVVSTTVKTLMVSTLLSPTSGSKSTPTSSLRTCAPTSSSRGT
jgi:hypothetical protein